MKKTLLLSLFTLLTLSGYCKVWTIVNSGFTFSPDTISIGITDTVVFKLAVFHNAQEVSEAAYLANDSLPKVGFVLPFGGDTLFPGDLSVGAHYYICQPHVAQHGMKGLILVENPTSVFSGKGFTSVSTAYPNPAVNKVIIETPASDLITVSNSRGVQLLSKVVPSGQTKTEIDISSLEAGVYYFMISRNGAIVETKKVIKN